MKRPLALPPMLDVDAALEWLKERCTSTPRPEVWTLYHGLDRRVLRSEFFDTPDQSELRFRATTERYSVVAIEGSTRRLPLEHVAIVLMLDCQLNEYVGGVAKPAFYVIGHDGEVWDKARTQAGFIQRHEQWRNAHLGIDPLEWRGSLRLQWILELIRRENAESQGKG